jgi:hypothetical protein
VLIQLILCNVKFKPSITFRNSDSRVFFRLDIAFVSPQYPHILDMSTFETVQFRFQML